MNGYIFGRPFAQHIIQKLYKTTTDNRKRLTVQVNRRHNNDFTRSPQVKNYCDIEHKLIIAI